MSDVGGAILSGYMVAAAIKQLREIREALGLPADMTHENLIRTLGELRDKTDVELDPDGLRAG